MKNRVPVLHPMSWLMSIPQAIILVLCLVISAALLWSRISYLSLAVGASVYLLYSFGSRAILTRHHKRGIRLVKRGVYQQSIAAFEQSYEFFSKYPWVDRYRALTMLMPSYMSYREMALVNIAFGYSQLGDAQKTKAAYQRVLDEFPNSAMAQVTMNFIQTMEQSAAKTTVPLDTTPA